jgi:beta-N-acetylhexosaminidase
VKIGQMLLVGFRGLTVDDGHPIVRDIRDRSLGGVILFDYDVPSASPVRNIASPGQVRELVASLQSYADIPLLVAIDQEGGRVCRLKEEYGFPPTVSARFLGDLNDPGETFRYAGSIAATLADLGINLNFAPVVDLDVDPESPVIGKLDRSFSADPEVAAGQALAFIRAHHRRGVLCIPKHFPGHGGAAADTHLGMADVTETWSDLELFPYRSLMANHAADGIMTAHVFNAWLDPVYPATLSRRTVTDLLRREMGFEGPVFSDDMQMKAVSEHYGFETAVERALVAGVDVLVIANNSVYDENIAARAVSVIRRLVRDGKIGEERIDRSYRRIKRLKDRLNDFRR